MKRTIILLACLVLILTGCEQKAADNISSSSSPIQEPAMPTFALPDGFDWADKDRIGGLFTNAQADMWFDFRESYNLVVLRCVTYSAAMFEGESGTFKYTGQSIGDVISQLPEVVDAGSLHTILTGDPYVFCANTINISGGSEASGWGTRTIEGVDFPWRVDATATNLGWYTDAQSFMLSLDTEPVDVSAELASIVEAAEQFNSTEFTVWYLENSGYQGIAWYDGSKYYGTLTVFLDAYSKTVTIAGEGSMDALIELATHYDMQSGVEDLIHSEPYYTKS